MTNSLNEQCIHYEDGGAISLGLLCVLKTTVNYVNLQDLTLNITAHALHVGVNVQGTRRKLLGLH